jgi:hypothetical protein
MSFESAFGTGSKMAAFRVIARSNCGTRGALGRPCDGCGLAITMSDWMCLMCADDWKAIRLHEYCHGLWQDERQSRIPGTT